MRWLYYTIKTWLSNHWHWLLVSILAVCFFFMASSYNYLTQSTDFVKWSSPDESANYFLTKLYAESGDLVYEEKNNLYAQGIIMPRSFRSDGALVKPVSFLGMIIIYGTISHYLGNWVIPYLTPAFAAVGLIFFYLIILRLFKRDVALVSTFILASFPVYIYFSARSMFHNIPFIVLWLAGLYFTIKLNDSPKKLPIGADSLEKRAHYLSWLTAALAGFLTGLAATTRSSELIWLLPILLLLWLFNFYRLGLIKLLIFGYFFALAFLPILCWNTVLYNSPTSTGYPKMDESISNIASSSTQLVKASASINKQEAQASVSVLEKAFFYFGFKQDHSQKMFYHYIFKMFTWLVISASLGFIFLIFKFKTKRKNDLLYLLCLSTLSIILIFYYGSWIFYDNPDPNSYTIGNSYTRYWLPIYLGIIPLAALAIVKLTSWLKWLPLIWGVRAIIIALIMFSSLWFVLYGSAEGLAFSMTRQLESRAEFDQLLNNTPANSVIITRYHDKLLFPERKVVVGLLTDQNMNRLYARLVSRAPLYYYNFTFNDKDFNYLNQSRLKEAGLYIMPITKITKDFTLYRLYPIEP